MNDFDARLHNVVNDRLFQAYWASVEHYKTTDLVLYFDTEVDVDPVRSFVRERLLTDPDAPTFFKQKVSKPARDASVKLKDGSTAFWLIVSFPNDEMITMAVIAQRLGEGGAA